MSAYKIDENRILVKKTYSYIYPCYCIICQETKEYYEENGLVFRDSFMQEFSYKRTIRKIPEMEEICDFVDEDENDENSIDIIVFNKKNLLIFYNEYNLFVYDCFY